MTSYTATVISLACALGLAFPATVGAQEPAALPGAENGASPSALVLTLANLRQPTGQVMVALFDDAAAFNGRGEPVRSLVVPVDASSASVTIEGLEPGEYALKLFHDLDGNGKMGMNGFGMPTEPYAFSKNAPVSFGPPRWDQAVFTVEGETVQTVSFR
ncbi:MAG: DUF2141 domain-containing protein [Sphingomonadaceae bacterium]|nr:DUF2141 domain-containing protein [Sphingomonadaceae bacterium]